MKKFILTVFILVLGLVSASTQNFRNSSDNSSSSSITQQSESATITFKNKSDYNMTLKVMYHGGGLYKTVTLSPQSSRVVSFSRSNSFKLKIKEQSLSLFHLFLFVNRHRKYNKIYQSVT